MKTGIVGAEGLHMVRAGAYLGLGGSLYSESIVREYPHVTFC